jgi:hypothetical protein
MDEDRVTQRPFYRPMMSDIIEKNPTKAVP